MKKLLLLATLAALSVSCSTSKEKYENRQAEAREEYDESLKEAQEEYRKDELDERKEAAKEMIDDSDDLNLKEDEGKIQVDD